MITDDQLDDLKHELLGTQQILDVVLERLDIDATPGEAEDRLLDGARATEICVVCRVWHESIMLEESSDDNGCVCRECRPEIFGLE